MRMLIILISAVVGLLVLDYYLYESPVEQQTAVFDSTLDKSIIPPIDAEMLRQEGKAWCMTDGNYVIYWNRFGTVISGFRVQDAEHFLGRHAGDLHCWRVGKRVNV